jgi:hypothetical protein
MVWIAAAILSVIFLGMLNTFIYALALHIVVLRVIPKAVFGYEAMGYIDIYYHILLSKFAT